MYKLTFLLATVVFFLNCKNPSEKKEAYTSTRSSEESQTPLALSMQRGLLIYEDFCVTCHGANGKTENALYPPLAASDYLLNNRMESVRAVKYGQQGEIIVNGRTYNGIMAPLGLEDDEVADVMNYILNSWGNRTDKMVTKEEVASVEK